MNDGNGDGDGGTGIVSAPSTGFTQYVEKREFQEFCNTIETALWGADKRNGLVADVNELKIQIKLWMGIIAFITGIVSPLITVIILKFFGM